MGQTNAMRKKMDLGIVLKLLTAAAASVLSASAFCASASQPVVRAVLEDLYARDLKAPRVLQVKNNTLWKSTLKSLDLLPLSDSRSKFEPEVQPIVMPKINFKNSSIVILCYHGRGSPAGYVRVLGAMRDGNKINLHAEGVGIENGSKLDLAACSSYAVSAKTTDIEVTWNDSVVQYPLRQEFKNCFDATDTEHATAIKANGRRRKSPEIANTRGFLQIGDPHSPEKIKALETFMERWKLRPLRCHNDVISLTGAAGTDWNAIAVDSKILTGIFFSVLNPDLVHVGPNGN